MPGHARLDASSPTLWGRASTLRACAAFLSIFPFLLSGRGVCRKRHHMAPAPIVLTERQAAHRLGLDYLYRLRTDGPRRRSSTERPLPPGPTVLRIGRRIFYRPADLDAWLAALADGSIYARQSRGRGRPRKIAA